MHTTRHTAKNRRRAEVSRDLDFSKRNHEAASPTDAAVLHRPGRMARPVRESRDAPEAVHQLSKHLAEAKPHPHREQSQGESLLSSEASASTHPSPPPLVARPPGETPRRGGQVGYLLLRGGRENDLASPGGRDEAEGEMRGDEEGVH